jgi:hypothetical protein
VPAGWRHGRNVRGAHPAAVGGLNSHQARVDEDIVIPIAGMIMTVVLFIGFPLVIVHARKLWKRDSAGGQDSSMSDHRLERIEQAIDAMAVEVERISESQRFMTKLLADRSNERASIPASHSRHEA